MTPEDRIKKLGSSDEATPSEAEWAEFRSKAHRTVARRRVAAALGGAALVLAIVGGAYAIDLTPPQRGPNVVEVGETPRPTDGPSPGTVALQQWFIENDKLQVFYAHVRLDGESPVRDAAEELVTGVPSILAETGVSTAIPDGTRVGDVSVSGRTASVTLMGDFPDETDTQEDFATAQLAYTLTQFKDIDDVAVSWESVDSGGVAAPAQDREGFENLLPPIVVESPYPGQSVEWTFDLAGIANVFEATVSWRLEDLDGNLIQEGFVTAECGSGCWGTFRDRIAIERTKERRMILEVFESSAEDGSSVHLVSIPLNFPKER